MAAADLCGSYGGVRSAKAERSAGTLSNTRLDYPSLAEKAEGTVTVFMELNALSLGLPRMNQSGTLLEGISLWGELKQVLTVEAVIERAMRYCDLAVSQGLLAIRSHVDVCDDRMTGVTGLLEVRDKVKDYIDLQLVPFPQDGYYRSPDAQKNLLQALDMGVDIVGGIPHFERTMAQAAARRAWWCCRSVTPSRLFGRKQPGLRWQKAAN